MSYLLDQSNSRNETTPAFVFNADAAHERKQKRVPFEFLNFLLRIPFFQLAFHTLRLHVRYANENLKLLLKIFDGNDE